MQSRCHKGLAQIVPQINPRTRTIAIKTKSSHLMHACGYAYGYSRVTACRERERERERWIESEDSLWFPWSRHSRGGENSAHCKMKEVTLTLNNGQQTQNFCVHGSSNEMLRCMGAIKTGDSLPMFIVVMHPVYKVNAPGDSMAQSASCHGQSREHWTRFSASKVSSGLRMEGAR